jgi:molecular chaperone GrpE
MKQKRKEKPKEERQEQQRKNELADLYVLLDKLLPLGKEHLSEVLEKEQKHLVNIRDKEKDDLKYALEIEKAKNSVWKEYANIVFAQYQRISADYANFQKRVPKQIADTICYEKEKIIKTLLPALDNFEHTLQNANSAENADVFVKGIRIIYDQMLDILKSQGVEQIKAPGENFDPALHEAMMQKTEPEEEDNIVLEEFQKGYKLNGRVIRPSKVIVNKLTEDRGQKTEDGGQKTEDGTEVE